MTKCSSDADTGIVIPWCWVCTCCTVVKPDFA